MNIITLLEHLANNAHHRVAVNELTSCQSNEVKTAFMTNDGAKLRSQLGDTENLADKSAVVQILI